MRIQLTYFIDKKSLVIGGTAFLFIFNKQYSPSHFSEYACMAFAAYAAELCRYALVQFTNPHICQKVYVNSRYSKCSQGKKCEHLICLF
ncbi:hypothetical protein FKM82_013896 [Ascaphus truei]